jgi:hypothetical protein
VLPWHVNTNRIACTILAMTGLQKIWVKSGIRALHLNFVHQAREYHESTYYQSHTAIGE